MPLGLLLSDVVGAFQKGAAKIARWSDLVWLEQLLIRRAESAFIVRWFGRSVPVVDLSLHVAIANLASLQDRYRAVTDELARRRAAPETLSLTGPVAGLVGTAAGVALSPLGMTVIVGSLFQRLSSTTGVLGVALYTVGAAVLGWIAGAFGLGVGGVIAGLALPLGILAAPALAGTEGGQRVHAFSSALAEMLDAMTAFVRQLLGPRSEVRNPLLGRLIDLAGSLSTLFTHLAGALAATFVWLREAIAALRMQLPAFVALVQGTTEFVGGLLSDIAASLEGLVHGPNSVMANVRVIIGALTEFGLIVMAVFEILPGDMKRRADDWWTAQTAVLKAWWKTAQAALLSAFEAHPFGAAIAEGIRRVALARQAFAAAAPPSSPSPPSSGSSSGTLAALQSVARALVTPPPLPTRAEVDARVGGPPLVPLTPGAIGTVATGRAAVRALIRGAAPGPIGQALAQAVVPGLELSRASRERLDRARNPQSAFVVERRRLRGAADRPPAEQFAQLRAQELPYRQALYQIVANVLPREVAPYVVELDDTFRAIDRHLYGERVEARDFEPPVRAILESRRLQPVIRRLVVWAPASEGPANVDRSALNAWTDRLKETLETQSYVAAE